MDGKKIRTSLFGFNKSDVCEYIRSMDEHVELRLKDKEREIAELKKENAELREHREAVVSVLQTAEKSAKTIVEDAQRNADELKMRTDREVAEQKGLVNREIEIKRRAIKNYYNAENKKIAQIKNEVEKLRKASLEAIRRLETELSEIEMISEQKAGMTENAVKLAENAAVPSGFDGVERSIPINTVTGNREKASADTSAETETLNSSVKTETADNSAQNGSASHSAEA